MLTFSDNPDIAEQQMNAIIFYMTAFGYIDGDFDLSEKDFIRKHISELIEKRADDAMPDSQEAVRVDIITRFTQHFHEVFEGIDREIQGLFTEVVAKGEKVQDFVYAKLKLRSYEIFQSFEEDNQKALLATIDEFIKADGKVHPEEAKFRDEIQALLDSAIPELAGLPERIQANIDISDVGSVTPTEDNHPFFAEHEQHYSADPIKIRQQAEKDLDLMNRTMSTFAAQRQGGEGKLQGVDTVSKLAGSEPFLDGHVYVHPIKQGEKYELIVLGDLHGCYSCLKAALMQSDFFAKVEAHRIDPENQPDVKLILLGDYIDRGRFSYNGVLRTVQQLFLSCPENVYVLRGNHEYYLEYNGRIYGGVRPAEAINSLVNHMPQEVFESYMALFESMPNVLLFGDMMFVHAGIPRDAAWRKKWKDLSTLNDEELRFQMLWSDPSPTDYIPDELQAQNARFPFGRKQFENFMQNIGCTTLVRGHEKILEGFRPLFQDGNAVLLNIFSAGGATNEDLPKDSSYRVVTPMALTISVSGEERKVMPWEIDYERYNDPTRNLFFASPPEIEHRQ